jgi:hypothetical protein
MMWPTYGWHFACPAPSPKLPKPPSDGTRCPLNVRSTRRCQPAPRLSVLQRALVFGLLVLHVVLAWLTRAVAIGRE